jgi:two-component system NtrC family response regulator
MAKILVVDDDPNLALMLGEQSRRLGHDAVTASTLGEGVEQARQGDFDLVFLDVQMPDGNGLEFLARFREVASRPEVIIITGKGDPEGASKAITSGAWGYVEKPHVIKDLHLHMVRALQYREEKNRAARVPVILRREEIIGSSPKINHCLEQLAQAAMSDVSVLITGETGTGKELFARAIHANSGRSAKNFVVVDCAALPDNLIESTLFGHEKGAFTGADRGMVGLVKQADGGTLFLDEVGELPLQTQKAFLRVLQEHAYRPVGGSSEIRSDFRLVAATNRDLEKEVAAGAFRTDLLFRLQASVLHLPPLRERPEDLRPLAGYFVNRLSRRYGQEEKAFGVDFVATLAAYDWPGNVRELAQTLEHAFTAAFHSPTLYPNHLPDQMRILQAQRAVRQTQSLPPAALSPGNVAATLPSWRKFRDRCEREYLLQLLAVSKGNISAASRLADLSRTHLYQLLAKYDLP